MQQLVDTRRTQVDSCGDLSHGKTLPMGRANSDGTIPLSSIEPLRRGTETLANPLLSLEAVAA
ncbi:MAG: hypothetical protein JO352_24740 [Chloroflexi bacterium]|nr:hypothetical protein [Chloroflexota bacterium]MBV9600198.1 hypothetical protein [Chloroflexota bacterium]